LISLDTNILVYATDRKNAGARHALARRIVDAAKNVKIGLAEQVLVEFINVAVRKTRLPLNQVAPYVDAFSRDFPLLLPSRDTVAQVLALLFRHNLSVWDAHILAVCSSNGCNHLLSEDLQDGSLYGGVTVVNPFVPRNARLLQRLLA
jgi:predicted nucleic acid-binding protein